MRRDAARRPFMNKATILKSVISKTEESQQSGNDHFDKGRVKQKTSVV